MFRPIRDPFRSAYERVRLKREGEVHPLQRYNIQQLRLVGIIWGIPRPVALVTTPDGREYQVSEGTPVGTGDGKVVAILNDRIVIVERYYDYRGQLQTERFELVLKKEK
jgi:type IV pilus assembly protein PilP